MKVGEKLFSDDICARARDWLRAALVEVGRPHSDRVSLHSVRRGAARAFVARGGSLVELCAAGPWSSRAFAAYLDMPSVQMRALGGPAQ